jgi:transcriptional regulator with XRE-family HTH domain
MTRPYLAQLLKTACKDKRWSAAELGRRLRSLGQQVTDQAVRGWLRGAWEPSRESLAVLALLLELHPSDLLQARGGLPDKSGAAS